jgi:hypothetical protein
MREFHVSIVYHPPATATLGTLFDLFYAKRPDVNQNCVLCWVSPDISDAAAVEKVREYFLKGRRRKAHEFELRLGHNERKEVPHREGEPELLINADGVIFKPSIAEA